jgi:hypothetical protein
MICADARSTGKPSLVVCVFYNGSEDEGKENFKAFLDIGKTLQGMPASTLTVLAEHIFSGAKEIPYETVNTLQVRHTLVLYVYRQT